MSVFMCATVVSPTAIVAQEEETVQPTEVTESEVVVTEEETTPVETEVSQTDPESEDITIIYRGQNEDSSGYDLKTVVVSNVKPGSTFNDFGIDLSVDCPVPVEGLKFVGWSQDYVNVVSGDDMPIVNITDQTVTLIPVFDKGYYSLSLTYVTNAYTIKTELFKGTYDLDETPEQVANRLVSEGKVSDMLMDGFVGWEISGKGASMPGCFFLGFTADYEKIAVNVTKSYLCDEGYVKMTSSTVFVDPGTTYEDLTAEITAQKAPEDLYPGLRFFSWYVNTDLSGVINDSSSNYTYIEVIPDTENTYVQYLLDPSFKQEGVLPLSTAGTTPDMIAEFRHIEVVEKGTTVTVPEKFDGYKSFELYFSRGATAQSSLQVEKSSMLVKFL